MAVKYMVRGRPRLEIDYWLLGKLAGMGMAANEIAPLLKISLTTFRSRWREDTRFRQIVEHGWANASPSMFQAQMKRAHGRGKSAASAAIWLSRALWDG